MSQAIKAFSNFTFTYSKYALCRPLCTYGKDIIKQPTTNSTPQDFLLQNLKIAPNPKNVFELVSSHYNIMNSKHIMQALRTVFDLQKQGSSNLSTKELLRHPTFDKLCKKLKSQAGVIELNETIEALKIISYVGVPSDSHIVQILLQLIRYNVNALSLKHIMFLEFLLGQFKSSPLVDALKIALPIVFEIQLPLKMDRDNISNMTECLYYVSKAHISNATVELIVKNLSETDFEFDGKTAKSIIWSLSDMRPNDCFESLLNKAVNNAIVHLDELTYSEMETTLSKLVSNYSMKYPFYYNEVFFDSCANYVIDNDLGFKHAVFILRKFSRLHHFNRYLLDYMTKKALEEPNLVRDPVNIFSIAVAVSLTDYRPTYWDQLKELLVKTKNVAEIDRKEIIWMKFAAALCLLDIFKVDVLSKCFNVNELESMLHKMYKSDVEQYLTIYWSIKLYKPDLADLLPSKYEPSSIVNKFRPIIDFPLESVLEKALGGENYFFKDLLSKFGHQIDHAILFRKGGYPTAVTTKDVQYIEDIDVPSDSQLVLIMCLRPIHYTINNRLLRQSVSLSIQMLLENGYNVVPVCLKAWEELNDFEKIPYLMQMIKTKVSGEFNAENVLQY